MSLKTSYVILRTADMKRGVEFWRDRVGLPEKFVSDEFSGFDAGGITLMLQAAGRPPVGDPESLLGLTEIVLESGDVLAARAAMESRGVVFRTEHRPVTSDGTRDLLAADARDPDGHVFSITGWVPKG